MADGTDENNGKLVQQKMSAWKASARMVQESMARAPWVEGRPNLNNPVQKRNTVSFSKFLIK